jgi:hypothetical protein
MAATKCLFFLVGAWQTVVAPASSVSYVTGPFTIHYDARQTPTLRVTETGRSGDVWFTPAANGTFVTAAAVDETVEQNGGTFVFRTSVREVCSDVTVSRNGSRPSKNGHEQVRVIFAQ